MIFFYAVRIVSMNQAAESVAVIPRMIPGALRQPKIATRAKNETAEMMMIEEVMVWFGLCRGLDPAEWVKLWRLVQARQ